MILSTWLVSIYLYDLCAYILFMVSLKKWSLSFRIIAKDYAIIGTDVNSTSHQLYIMYGYIWKTSYKLWKQI